MFCNALGAELTTFSRQEDKLADAKTLGAAYVVHAVGDSYAKPSTLEFNLITSTADVTKNSPLDAYMKCVSHRLSRSSPPLSSRRLPHRARPFVLVDRR
jgi:D-arabinose 1-dehydrogenase-like Zn-dependent alcohol dehydrogenase